ncbi:carboxylesterase/lipase family protein [Streptosporangium becharense]|nr:carboxylesterase family protein [Streptosporangium becharense]
MDPIVKTEAGAVRGVRNPTHLTFRNIPYAAPPVGRLRFAAAQPAPPWAGVLDGTGPGPVAPQRFEEIDRRLGAVELPSDEAGALHLTVHTPGLEGKRPVFVWIHGGSYTSGSSAWRIYDGARFARDGVVFVGFNYRLGAFGFLDLRAHFPDDGLLTANPALSDAVLALRWIRDNIAAFGGDPDSVTIAGESAGAGMVTALLTSPQARGLFHRAVPQSGMNFCIQEPEQSAAIAGNLLRRLGVRAGDRAALEAVSTETLLQASEDRACLLDGVPGGPHLAWNMHRDPETLPTGGYEPFAAGSLSQIDLLIGTTADENKLRWLAEEPTGIDEGVDIDDPEQVRRLREVYRKAGRAEKEWEISEAIVNDLSYLVPATRAAEEHARHGGRTFMYLFTWRSPVLDGRLGACHALENAFVFDRLQSPEFHGPRPPQWLADAIHGAWIRFARTGRPGHPLLPEWPEFDPESRAVMELGATCRVVYDPRGREFRAWRDLPASVFGVA